MAYKSFTRATKAQKNRPKFLSDLFREVWGLGVVVWVMCDPSDKGAEGHGKPSLYWTIMGGHTFLWIGVNWSIESGLKGIGYDF